MKIQGVNFNVDAVKALGKDRFVSQYGAKFKNIDEVCKMLGIAEAPKKKKKKIRTSEEKIEAKLDEVKVDKPQFE